MRLWHFQSTLQINEPGILRLTFRPPSVPFSLFQSITWLSHASDRNELNWLTAAFLDLQIEESLFVNGVKETTRRSSSRSRSKNINFHLSSCDVPTVLCHFTSKRWWIDDELWINQLWTRRIAKVDEWSWQSVHTTGSRVSVLYEFMNGTITNRSGWIGLGLGHWLKDNYEWNKIFLHYSSPTSRVTIFLPFIIFICTQSQRDDEEISQRWWICVEILEYIGQAGSVDDRVKWRICPAEKFANGQFLWSAKNEW